MSFAAETFLTDILGAKNIQRRGDELIHACLLPYGNHANDYKSPGASLNSEKLLYNCFKCSSGGTLLWAVEEILGIGSADARRLIKGTFDPAEMSEDQFLGELESMWKTIPSEAMPRYSLKIVQAWKRPSKFMDSRGISREVQDEMITGVNLENVDDVGGIMFKQPRVVIPHIFKGVVRGWTMRLIDYRQIGSKYKHTGQFPKKNTLYNWDDASKYNSVIVVESPMSVLKLKSEGIGNVVATFGAEVNEGQVDLLSKFEEVIAFPDGDLAGYRALNRLGKRGKLYGLVQDLAYRTNMWIVDHGRLEGDRFNEKDPADYTGEEVKGLLNDRIPAITWDWRDESANKKVYASKVRESQADWEDE